MDATARLPSLDDRAHALEDLRSADRLLDGVLGTLGFVKRQQWFDAFGFGTSEGANAEQTRADVEAAERDLTEAQHVLRRAIGRLGARAENGWVGLEPWGYAEAVFDGFFDLLATARAGRNVEAAQRVRAEVRRLFETVRASDPALAPRVQPLAPIEVVGVGDELRTQWTFNKSAVLGRIAVAVALIGMFIAIALSR